MAPIAPIDRTLSLIHRSGPAGLPRLHRFAVAGTLLCTLLCTVALGSTALGRLPFGAAATRIITLPVGHEPAALGVDERSGHVFVANYTDGTISVLDARRGRRLRTIVLGQHPLSLVVDEAAGRVFTLNAATGAMPLAALLPGPAASASGSVSVLDARSGAVLRTVMTGALPSALALDAQDGHILVFSSGDSTLSLLDAHSGGVVATVALGGLPQALAADARAGCLYVGTTGTRGRLLVLDSRTGRRLRTLTLGHSVGAVLAVPAAGRVVVAGDGLLRLFTACGHTLLRTVRAAVVPLLAAAGSARVLVTGAAGLRLLDARTGRWAGPWVLGDANLPPVWSEDTASDPTTGNLVVAVQPAGATTGLLAVLDRRRGRVRRLLPAGPDPSALAVDARTQRVIVLLPDGAPTSQGAGPLAGVVAWGRRWLPWLPLPRTPVASTGGSVRLIPLR